MKRRSVKTSHAGFSRVKGAARPVADARPSNAGDRYHLAYVARRLLRMLHPSSDLACVTIENVAPADQSAAIDERSFLGVDVTEYEGRTSLTSAHKVTVSQVKYSPLRPESSWTLARLARNDRVADREKQRSSVLRKLADMYRALAGANTRATPIVVRLVTNQPLSADLRADINAIRSALNVLPLTSANALREIPGRAGRTAHQIKAASGLNWPNLAGFIRSWDLEAFGQASLFTSEAELFHDFAGAYPEAWLRLDALFGELQSASTPRRRVTLDRTFTFAALRLLEEELFPAPPVCGDGADLFATAASEALLNELNASDGIVAVHGLAGIGKTSALLVALREHGAGVLYDCYAGGRGLRPGQERFEYPVCFTQVINELEGRFNTGMLATTRLDYRPLLGRLIESVGAAAKKAGQFGKRLVIAFDAVDNAVEQKRRTIGDTRPSFVQMLLQIEWPPNCVVVVSFRSENERERLGRCRSSTLS